MPASTYNLATIEVFGLAPALVIADEVLKATRLELVGAEGNAGQDTLVKFVGDAASCERAVEVAEAVGRRLGARLTAAVRLRFDETDVRLIHAPQEYSPITEGYLHMLPRTAGGDWETSNMKAIGILETQGLTGVLEGADAMLKAADVEIIGKEKIGAAHVTVMIRGDVAAVKAAIDAGKAAADKVGKVVAAHVIARPHDGLARLLPE